MNSLERLFQGCVTVWILVLVFGCVADVEGSVSCESPGWKTLWQDDFDGDALDTNVWSYELYDAWQYGFGKWGNKEAQFYTKENVKVEDGVLKLIAEYEPNSERLFQLCWDECYQRCVNNGKVEGTDEFRCVLHVEGWWSTYIYVCVFS